MSAASPVRLICLGLAVILSATVPVTAGEPVEIDLSGAFNYDLVGSDAERFEARDWGLLHPAANVALADVFGDHQGLGGYLEPNCFWMNDGGGLPVSGRVVAAGGTYHLGPAARDDVTTHQRSPNAILFGKLIDRAAVPVDAMLPAGQRGRYSDVNFLLTYMYSQRRIVGTPDRAIRIWALYETGSPGLLYQGTVLSWSDADTSAVFRAGATCSTYLSAYGESPRRACLVVGTRRLWEFRQPLAADTSRVLTGFRFEVTETEDNVAEFAAVFAAVGRLAEEPPAGNPTIQVGLDREWIYQNTPALLAASGHRATLAVAVADPAGNTSFSVQVNKKAGSGAGEISVEATANPLVKSIVGSLRTDQGAGAGPLTLEVVVVGDAGGVATAEVSLDVRKLGDVSADGNVTTADGVELTKRLNGITAGVLEYDLDANGSVTTADSVLLTKILNNLPVD